MEKPDINGFILDNIQFLNLSIQDIEVDKQQINSLLQRKENGELISKTTLNNYLKDIETEIQKIDDIYNLTSCYLTQISYSEKDFT